MSRPSWQDSLVAMLKRPDPDPAAPAAHLRVAVLGVGHALRGDDAAGLAVARRLRTVLGNRQAGLLVIEAGSAPENYTGVLRRFKPDRVIIVDAAVMDAEPGRICWLDPGEIAGAGISTHTMPLTALAGFLEAEMGCGIGVIGIQPGQTGIGASLSPPLEAAVGQVVEKIVQTLSEWRP